MITVCTLHTDCAVTHDDAHVCPICVAIDDATFRAARATDQLDQARARLAPLVALLFPSLDGFAPDEAPRPTGEVKVPSITDPGPGREAVKALCAALETRLSRADIDAIRATGTGPAVGADIASWRGRVPALLAYRDQIQSAVALLESAPRPTVPTEEPTLQSVQPDPDEPGPTEREDWTRARIAELKADLQTWNGLAKIREAQTGTAPGAHLSAPALRQAIAEYEYDHRAEVTEAVDDIPF